MRVTEQEVRLIAYYGWTQRLDSVLNTALSYQTARRAHDEALKRVATAQSALDAVHELNDQLPADLDLLSMAELQVQNAQLGRDAVQTALAHASDAFVDAAGQAMDAMLLAMESHDWRINKPTLVVALDQCVV